MRTIRIYDVSKNYGDILALDRVNLKLTEGKIFGLLG